MDVLGRERAAFTTDPTGSEPEQVLVFQTVGSVDGFANALYRIPGLESVGEQLLSDLDGDDDFHVQDDLSKPVETRLYLAMANVEGLNEVKRMWDEYVSVDDPSDFTLPLGFGRFKSVFEQLRDVRFWSPRDRVLETGLGSTVEELRALGVQDTTVETELWWRQSPSVRERVERELVAKITSAGGELLARSEISEIEYHALLTRLPVEEAQAIADGSDIGLSISQEVMYFRPTGQSAVRSDLPEDLTPSISAPDQPLPSGVPNLALLDGVPLDAHPDLSGRIEVDDPTDRASVTDVANRIHGTMSSSLITRGDLSADEEPLDRLVYVRPIMTPDAFGYESIPSTMLDVDVIHEAVLRALGHQANSGDSRGPIKIFVLPIAHRIRVRERFPAPLARLLDYLSERYGILFILAAGNHAEDLQHNGAWAASHADPGDGTACETPDQIARAYSAAWPIKGIRSPGESINAITVGSLNQDSSPPSSNGVIAAFAPFPFAAPDLVTGQGPGIRRSIKPEFLVPGGATYVRHPIMSAGSQTDRLELLNYSRLPGALVAAPGLLGTSSTRSHQRGTSVAAALTARSASRVLDSIAPLIGNDFDEFGALATKALLVHGATWRPLQAFLGAVGTRGQTDWQETFARLVGYGSFDPLRSLFSSETRVTMIGYGALSDGEADRYEIPIPSTLNAIEGMRRLTITSATFSPINPRHQGYRRAHIWFDTHFQDAVGNRRINGPDLKDIMRVSRQEADWQAARRGTVQHEIFEGSNPTNVSDSTTVGMQVNCREDAGRLESPVRYVLAVTLEVAPSLGLPIYEQVSQRIRERVAVQAISPTS